MITLDPALPLIVIQPCRMPVEPSSPSTMFTGFSSDTSFNYNIFPSRKEHCINLHHLTYLKANSWNTIEKSGNLATWRTLVWLKRRYPKIHWLFIMFLFKLHLGGYSNHLRRTQFSYDIIWECMYIHVYTNCDCITINLHIFVADEFTIYIYKNHHNMTWHHHEIPLNHTDVPWKEMNHHSKSALITIKSTLDELNQHSASFLLKKTSDTPKSGCPP